MFNITQKNRLDFGDISVNDDVDIEVHKVKRASGQGLWTESLRLLRDVILIVAVFVLFGVFVAQPVVVEGTSMVPQLQNGERLIVNKLVYYNFKGVSWGHLERGDIVVFWFPDDPTKSYIKRVIGLPKDTVEIRNQVVYINDKALNEPYISQTMLDTMQDLEQTEVKEHFYFVMGDNRGNSSDSRNWGLVPEKYIYGKAFFRYWRPSKLGFIEKGKIKIEEGKELPDTEEETEEEPDDDFLAEDG